MIKQVIAVRRDLKMRRGKECAQAAHAAMGIIGKIFTGSHEYDYHYGVISLWLGNGMKKIVVQVSSLEELQQLKKAADEASVLSYLVTDAGHTEFDGPTETAIAIGPDIDAKIDAICKDLTLY